MSASPAPPISAWLTKSAAATAVVLLPLVVLMATAMSTGHLMLGSIGVVLSAVAAWWLSGGREGGFAGLGLVRPESWLRTIGEGVALAAAAAVALALFGQPIASKFGMPDLHVFATMRDHPGELAQWLAVTWTTAAFGEEIVFRGFLIPRLSPVQRLGDVGWALGIIVSSLLFGLAHSYQGAGGAILSGVIGAVLGVGFVLGKRNLWRTITAHGLFDSVSLVLLFIQLRRG
jgi:membrane protease YdiL (CAAX protease family)